MAKVSMETSNFMSNVIQRLKEMDRDIKPITEKALCETQEIINDKAVKAMDDKYLPAKGRYSTGTTLDSLYTDKTVHWHGDTAYIDVGFSIRKGGLASIFLMYGTPRMKKDQKLYDAFFSKKTKNEVLAEQERMFYNELKG